MPDPHLSAATPLTIGKDRLLLPSQVAELRIHDIGTGEDHLVHAFDRLVEAPNWTPDGLSLILNSTGFIYKFDLSGTGLLTRILIDGLDDANNDHLVSPDGGMLYMSSRDGHIYSAAITGGPMQRITSEQAEWPGLRYYLHGIAPDGGTLAFCGLQPETPSSPFMANIFTVATDGGDVRQLTFGTAPADGPDYSPDGDWIYYNSEAAATVPGHAQIFRMRTDGTGAQQLTFDARVNWFPHPSPDGRHVLYLSYPEGTEKHPANVDVSLMLMDPDGGKTRELVKLYGGQGTINVPSWAPDSRRFAYMAYPFAE